ncbi:hypothetical protein HDU98_010770 [Podochytrium sp. JEL0797]|nr:hypothetical protein HDU98_010770 [Podochytrium sp. JEL0797]
MNPFMDPRIGTAFTCPGCQSVAISGHRDMACCASRIVRFGFTSLKSALTTLFSPHPAAQCYACFHSLVKSLNPHCTVCHARVLEGVFGKTHAVLHHHRKFQWKSPFKSKQRTNEVELVAGVDGKQVVVGVPGNVCSEAKVAGSLHAAERDSFSDMSRLLK